ncbi:MAG: hypothetical protein U0797_22090 [Gemmataceae bacterium]
MLPQTRHSRLAQRRIDRSTSDIWENLPCSTRSWLDVELLDERLLVDHPPLALPHQPTPDQAERQR